MTTNKKRLIVIILAVAFGAIRLFIKPSTPGLVDVYKDFVHVFMGGIAVVAWQGDRTCKWTFWLLCVLEVSVAVLSRIFG